MPRSVLIGLLAAAAAPVAVAADVPFGPRRPIASTTAFVPRLVAAVDVDGDLDLDLVWAGDASGSGTTGGAVWLENTDAHGAWGPAQSIASSAAFDASFAVADLDGDGDPDVVSTDVWYENAAGDGSSWVARSVPGAADPLWPADLDGDDDLDLLQPRVEWQENDGGSPPGWTVRDVGDAGGGVNRQRALLSVDLDGDEDLDVVSLVRPEICGSFCVVPGEIKWFENAGGSPPAWTEHDLPEPFTCVSAPHALLHAVDLDGDADLDIVLSCWGISYNFGTTGWYESDGAATPAFTYHELAGMGPAVPFDLDRDGDVDLLGPGDDPQLLEAVAWQESDGGSPPAFTVRAIDGPQFFPTAYAPFDVDLDGDTDFVASDNDGALFWHENRTPSLPAVPGPGALLLVGLLLAAVPRLGRLRRPQRGAREGFLPRGGSIG